MRKEAWIGLLLVAAGLTGCIGSDEQASEHDPARASLEQAGLPDGLAMEGAEVVFLDATTVVWRKNATVNPQVYAVAATRAPSITAFDLPEGVPVEVTANVTWISGDANLYLSLQDAQRVELCTDYAPAIDGYGQDRPATISCTAKGTIVDEDARWKTVVDHNVGGGETPYQLEVTLRLRQPAIPPGLDAQDLDTPPSWQPGDWWEVRLNNPLTEATTTYTVVVAEVGNGTAILGTSQPGLAEVIWLQATPLGQVPLDTLAWTIHGEPFEPVTFPLSIGASWETSFEGTPVTATVEDKSLVNATLVYEGDRFQARAVYDGRAGTITSFEADGSTFANFASEARWEVIDHGTGYQGPVYVPMDRTLAFTSGKTAPLMPGPIAHRPGTVEEHVPGGYTDLTLALVVGFPVESLIPQSSFYHEHVYAPNGEQWETTVHPQEIGGVHVEIHTAQQPSGTWDFERYGVGPGVSMTQGVAYTMVKWDAPGGEGVVVG